ncbi:DUF2877 domain-containing protein [Oryzobacter terrae]|uniref:oxamate carbamoyltransferase subunit AllH family protein n=1 Tax=Oryzobacter terrae TaxID=1620385 RepID=UPI00366FD124
MPSPSPRSALPAAASALTVAVVRGPVREAVVLGEHRLGLYLDVDGSVLPVVPSDAVALPTALRLGARSSALADGPLPWGVAAGDRILVGGGRVELPVGDVVAVRTWRPARVRRVAAGASCPGSREAVAALLLEASVGCDPWLAPATAAVLSRLPGPAGLDQLVGRGRGLTPSGDDALAGALLVAHALRVSRPLVAAVRDRLGTTTAVSAALLAAATDGFAARPVVALVDAVVLGHVDATARALPEVVALGHTSGRDLVTGVLEALRTHVPVPVRQTTTQTSTPTGRSAA